MDNKFKEREVVYAKVNTNQKLVVRRYVDRIYYCSIYDKPDLKDVVYFERELMVKGTKVIQNLPEY